MADIDIVQPADGAGRVAFNFTAASDALDALTGMTTKLNEQALARVTPRDDAVVSWSGYYRDEFDRAWNNLQQRFTAGAAAWTALPIYQAIGDANTRQTALNRAATQPRTGPPAHVS
ncbi:MAG TPA: hypothetical protein VGJ86_09925 [Acidimicrobiales bacterium]|jgi:hypothetical protein